MLPASVVLDSPQDNIVLVFIFLHLIHYFSSDILFFAQKKSQFTQNGVDSFFLVQIVHITDTYILKLSASVVQCFFRIYNVLNILTTVEYSDHCDRLLFFFNHIIYNIVIYRKLMYFLGMPRFPFDQRITRW